MIAEIDGALLGRVYVPLSRIAGAKFGSTACSLSRSCVAPMVVFGGIRCICAAEILGVGEAVFAVGLVMLLAMIFWHQAERADWHPNPFSFEPPIIRFVWVMIAPVFAATVVLVDMTISLKQVAVLGEALATLSVVYFRAVPNPPPKEQRRPATLAAAQEVAW